MVLKIGHRGASGHAPENTTLSVKKALELGVDMIEVDVRVCKTGETLLLHDSSVRRLFNNKGLISRKTFDEIIKEFVRDKKWSYEDFLISSFNKRTLKKFHEACPRVKIGWIFYIDDFEPRMDFKPNFSTKDLPLYSLHPNFRLVDKEFVDEAHKKGLKVFVWTVNEKEDIDKMISCGVDGIISDYPDRIRN